jgi:hypothetical protein
MAYLGVVGPRVLADGALGPGLCRGLQLVERKVQVRGRAKLGRLAARLGETAARRL